MVTIKQLKRSIEKEKSKLKKDQELENKRIEKIKLKKELFQLKNRKKISSAVKGLKILKKAGIGIIKVSKKATPIVKKQIKLIRKQQLRDEAIERKIYKKKKILDSKKKTKLNNKFNPIIDLNF